MKKSKIKSKTVVILSVLLVILVLVGLCVWYIAQQIPYGFPFGGKPQWISSVDDRIELCRERHQGDERSY